MVKVGLIGLGNWGKKVLPKFDRVCDVVYCSNRSDTNAQKWLSRNFPNVSHTFDYNEILANGTIEAVAITTPIETHYSLVDKSLDAGKHVFVEKPLATNSPDVKKLFEKAKRNNLNLFVGYIYTHSEIMRILMEINSTNPISSVNMQWIKYGSFDEDIYWNLLSHELSILYKLFGSNLKELKVIEEFRKVSALDKIHLNLLFSDDVDCSININRASKNKSKSKNVGLVISSGEVYEWKNDLLYKKDIEAGKIEMYRNNVDKLEMEIKFFINGIKSENFSYEENMNIFISDTILKIKNRAF